MQGATPKFIHIENKVYDENTYDEKREQDELKQAGKAQAIDNVIRWRMKKDAGGNAVPQGNARFITWSDGTTSLWIGDHTKVDVDFTDVALKPADVEKNNGRVVRKHFVVLRHGVDDVLETHADIEKIMTINAPQIGSEAHKDAVPPKGRT